MKPNPRSQDDRVDSQMALLVKGLKKLRLPMTGEVEDKFRTYLLKLLQWNCKMNLVSSRDETRIVERHFLESVSLLAVVDFPTSGRVLDLGTGAGFPGLPIKILRPDLVLTLLDSTRKKTVFLKEVVDSLGLKKVEVIWARAEEINQWRQYKAKYDVVLARAVASLVRLVDWGFPFLRKDAEGQRGMLVIMKGSAFAEELHQLGQQQKDKLAVKLIDYPAVFEKSKKGSRKILVIQPKV